MVDVRPRQFKWATSGWRRAVKRAVRLRKRGRGSRSRTTASPRVGHDLAEWVREHMARRSRASRHRTVFRRDTSCAQMAEAYDTEGRTMAV